MPCPTASSNTTHPSAPSRKTYLAPPPPYQVSLQGWASVVAVEVSCQIKAASVYVREPPSRSKTTSSKPSASLPASQPATLCCVTDDPSLSNAVCTAVGCHKICRNYTTVESNALGPFRDDR